jgi:pimeloyl-ACP methyl ester carboxylesterase
VPRNVPSRWHLFVVVLSCSLGCATARHDVLAPIPALAGQDVILSADGAGNSAGLTTALRQAVADRCLPVHVEKCEWSYGPGRFLADQMSFCHAREAGARLAQRACAYRQACPDSKISLIAHSAGCLVALAAAEQLPPDCLDKIVLLAPAVSSTYDLRPALRSAHRGIDVFTSERDVLILGAGVGVVGTTDRRWEAAAGRVGFQPVGDPAEDAALYGRLRQHPWEPSVAWTGNVGGHFDTYETRFFEAYVVPVLIDSSSAKGPRR